MKKILSLVVAFMMIGTTAFASVADDFREVWEDYADLKSYTCKTTMAVEVNEPLLFLEDIPLEDDVLDIPLMISDLLKSKATAEYQVNISDDYKKMQMSMSVAYDVPVTVNEDLKIEAFARQGMWFDYDMTNPDEPVYRMIMKTPVDNKYQVMDMSHEAGMVEEYLTPQLVEIINDATFEIIERNGDITKIKKGYRVKFDNDGLLGYIADIFKVVKMVVPQEEAVTEFDAIIAAIEGAKGNFKILGDDGLTLELTKNARGDITAYAESIHFDFNLYDLVTLLELDTEGLERERADFNITLKATSEMSGHNKTAVVMPEITEENSEFIYDGYEEDYENDEDYEYEEDIVLPYIWEEVYSDQVPYVDDGEIFMPVYDLLSSMYEGDFVITSDSLRYTASGENEYNIGQVFVKVGENSVMVDDEIITLNKPVVNEFDIFRVPMEFVEKLGFELDNIWISNGDTYYSLSKKNTDFWE